MAIEPCVWEPGQAPYPGVCVVCSDSSQRLIDIGVTRDWEGVVLLCRTCWNHFGKKFNFSVPKETYEELVAANYKLGERVEVIDEALREASDDISAVVAGFSGRVESLVGNRSVSVVSEPDNTEDSTGADESDLDFNLFAPSSDKSARV
jgi:hypothetical protein